MLDRLRKTNYIHGLIKDTVDEAGPKNMVMAGLSQGCAAALVTILTWEGEPLAAMFGFCGWLPLRGHMGDVMDSTTNGDHDDDKNLFGRSMRSDHERDPPKEGIAWLKEEIDLPTSSSSSSSAEVAPEGSSCAILLPFQRTAFFLGHGTEDEKVDVRLKREANACLATLKAAVYWKEYDGLGHWYSGQILGDLTDFLEEKTDGRHNSEWGDLTDVESKKHVIDKIKQRPVSNSKESRMGNAYEV